MPDSDRARLKIPAVGKYFAWSYPFALVRSWNLEDPTTARESGTLDPDVAFMTVGGFVYFDAQYQPVHINAAVPDTKGRLRFGPPRHLPHAWAERQLARGNFQPITLRTLLKQGASDYTWLPPLINHSSAEPDCPYGGFAYLGTGLADFDLLDEVLVCSI